MPTNAGPVSVRVVVVAPVVVAAVVVLEVALAVGLVVEEAVEVVRLVDELELLADVLAAAVGVEVVLDGAVTAGAALEPQAASVVAPARARPSVVRVGRIFIGLSVGSRSQSVAPAVMVRQDGSESDGP